MSHDASQGDQPASSNPPISIQGSAMYLALVCLVASLGGLLFGFDTAVISGTVGRVAGQFDLTQTLVGWFVSSALLGCILGAAIAGVLGDRFGRKPVLLAAALLFFISALYSTIPQTFTILITARMLGGIGVGMASVLAPMYISEFAPPKWRGRLVACYQLSIVIGILAAYFSNYAILSFSANNPEAFGGAGWLHRIMIAEVWRGMFGAEMIPAGLFFLLLFLVPESPRWLIKAGEQQRGFAILERISGTQTAQRELAEIQEALNREEGSIRELFRPGLRIALLVGIMLSVFGQLSGVNIVVYYGPLILKAAGFEEIGTLLGQVGFGLINLVFTILAIMLIDHLGRRPLLIYGMAVVTVMLTVIGLLFYFSNPTMLEDGQMAIESKAMGILIAISVGIYVAAFAFSICAVIWVLTPEIFPNRVRGRAASIATFANWSTNAISAQIFPIYVAALGMHAGFFTASVICLVATIFFFKLVPETKGKTLEQIERNWLTRA